MAKKLLFKKYEVDAKEGRWEVRREKERAT
jgi:hypothetical protein